MGVLRQIVERLQERAPIFQGRVSIAKNINNPTPESLPEAWVYNWTEIASPNTTVPLLSQDIDKDIGILISACTESVYEDGIRDAISEEVLAALINKDFTLGSRSWPLSYRSLEVVDGSDSQQNFRMTFTYRELVRG